MTPSTMQDMVEYLRECGGDAVLSIRCGVEGWSGWASWCDGDGLDVMAEVSFTDDSWNESLETLLAELHRRVEIAKAQKQRQERGG